VSHWHPAYFQFFLFVCLFFIFLWAWGLNSGEVPHPHQHVDCLSPLFFFFFFEMGSHYVAQVGLELEIVLPQPPRDYRYDHQAQLISCILMGVWWYHKKFTLHLWFEHGFLFLIWD
jgi:hypothetical protein